MRLRLTRYVVRAVIGGALLVLTVLVSIDLLFSVFGEVEHVGQGDYTLGTAILYLLLTVPSRIYELFPAAVAIGGVLGLGALAGHSELVVMRAAGISTRHIIGMVMQGGIVLMIAIVAIGEGVAPLSQQYAEQMRANAIAGQGESRGASGIWVRNGGYFIHVGAVLPGFLLRGIDIYQFNDHRMERALHVERARYIGDAWRLHDIDSTRIGPKALSTRHLQSAIWQRLIRPELVDLLAVSAQSLSIWRLYRYVEYLRANRLESARFELAFWQKIATPLSTLVMLLLALPMIFGSLRNAGTGQRVFIGSLIGIGYYLLSELFAHIGIVYGVMAPIAALAPAVLFTFVGIWALRRVV